jgi:hypothetical protein
LPAASYKTCREPAAQEPDVSVVWRIHGVVRWGAHAAIPAGSARRHAIGARVPPGRLWATPEAGLEAPPMLGRKRLSTYRGQAEML